VCVFLRFKFRITALNTFTIDIFRVYLRDILHDYNILHAHPTFNQALLNNFVPISPLYLNLDLQEAIFPLC
jgi:hypothetical protein